MSRYHFIRELKEWRLSASLPPPVSWWGGEKYSVWCSILYLHYFTLSMLILKSRQYFKLKTLLKPLRKKRLWPPHNIMNCQHGRDKNTISKDYGFRMKRMVLSLIAIFIEWKHVLYISQFWKWKGSKVSPSLEVGLEGSDDGLWRKQNWMQF